jgi:putative ABC transport system substrate-binding protein
MVFRNNAGAKAMSEKILGCLLVTFLLTTAAVAKAQPTTKIFRIGYLAGSSMTVNAARIEAFLQGLRELGYSQRKNFLFYYRAAEGKSDRYPALASELVGLKVDVIVTAGAASTRAAKEATSTIPIVMVQDSDPVGSGFIASLAQPGGNITGLSTLAPEISGKRLELLKEIVPKLSRVATLGTSNYPGNAQSLKETELAAAALGVRIQYLDTVGPQDIEPAFRAAGRESADAVLVLQSFVLNSHRKQIVNLAIKGRHPTIYYSPEWVKDGGLMSYGVSFTHLNHRAASYVDKILKGAKPGDLPVEQPTKFELVINLKAAKQIGLTIPPNVLARADRVIK